MDVGVDVVVACGVGPLVGSVRFYTGPVKGNTFLPAESPGRFAHWGYRQQPNGTAATCRRSARRAGRYAARRLVGI
jgi:hypothetical protein